VRVFDCFPLFNELDLLEIRMRLLEDVVDFFVVAEADRTFTNQPKPLHFAANRTRFQRWESKTVHLPVTLDPSGLDFSRPSHWDPAMGPRAMERQQRQALAAVRDLLDPGDVVLLSDADEIPSADAVDEARARLAQRGEIDGLLFRQRMHHYYLNMASIGLDRMWLGTCAVRAEHFRSVEPPALRSARRGFPRVSNGGWHFSFVGGETEIARKIGAYSHQEFNRPEVVDSKRIRQAIRTGRGVTDTKGHRYEYQPLASYPQALARIMADYPLLLLHQPPPRQRFDPLNPILRSVTARDEVMEAALAAKRRFDLALKAIRDRMR
jgi:beta-1,4-mannosyl-glycoprotein beta-1,4-N-acetylglucosaminyltransferase